MKHVAALILLSLLIVGRSLAQAKSQGHAPTKEQQAAQAVEAARVKALRVAKTAALVVRATTTVACPGGPPGIVFAQTRISFRKCRDWWMAPRFGNISRK
jgi:hypothetical protein